MLESIYVAMTGLRATQAQLDVVSNNLANMNTPAYKKSRVSFGDIVHRQSMPALSSISSEQGASRLGGGALVSAISTDHTPGDLKPTNNSMDIGINGEGFFEVELPGGGYGYTRVGALTISASGELQTANGHVLSAKIQLPVDSAELKILPTGEVLVRLDGKADMYQVGSIDLASFVNTSAMKARGDGVYTATPESGGVYYSEPGKNGLGEIRQGFLESANVDLITELLEMVVAQKAYQVNSQMLRASNEIMQLISNLND